MDFDTIETKIVCNEAGRIERIEPQDTQRRAPADRGVHAGGKRVRGRLHEALAPSRACTGCTKGPTPERLTLLREFLRTVALSLGGGDDPVPARLRASCRTGARASRRDAAAIDDVALDAAGHLHAAQLGPLRSGLRQLRAFHLADSPLSRPAHAPRDQGAARAASVTRHRLPARTPSSGAAVEATPDGAAAVTEGAASAGRGHRCCRRGARASGCVAAGGLGAVRDRSARPTNAAPTRRRATSRPG